MNLAARNIFNRGWHSEVWYNSDPLYGDHRQYYDPSAHGSINLSVTYTVGYDKKVQTGNEARGQDGALSAIIN